MARVLVTAATGFVGRHVVAELEAAGLTVTAATRRGAGSPERGVRHVDTGGIDGRTDWSAALEKVSALIHLAAHVHVAPERAAHDAELFRRVNRDGSLNLFRQAAARGVSRFIFLSTINVLGVETAPGEAFDDWSPPRPDTPYARSKREAEEALVAGADGSNCSLAILRAPLICGPGVKGNLRQLLRLAAAPLPLPFAGIDNRRTLLSAGNLIGTIRMLLERTEPVSGTWVLGDREPVSTTDILTALREGMGRSPNLFRVPQTLVRTGAGMVGRPGLYRRLFGDLVVDATRFRSDLGWSDRTDTLTTLRETGAAFRQARSR